MRRAQHEAGPRERQRVRLLLRPPRVQLAAQGHDPDRRRPRPGGAEARPAVRRGAAADEPRAALRDRGMRRRRQGREEEAPWEADRQGATRAVWRRQRRHQRPGARRQPIVHPEDARQLLDRRRGVGGVRHGKRLGEICIFSSGREFFDFVAGGRPRAERPRPTPPLPSASGAAGDADRRTSAGRAKRFHFVLFSVFTTSPHTTFTSSPHHPVSATFRASPRRRSSKGTNSPAGPPSPRQQTAPSRRRGETRPRARPRPARPRRRRPSSCSCRPGS